MQRIVEKTLMLASMLAVVVLAGCSSSDEPEEGVVWDISPVTVLVDVVDADGNDLLNPEVEGNIVDGAASVDYKGQTYPVSWRTPYYGYEGTRAYRATFQGALHHPVDRFKPVSAQNPWILEIGELAGDENYDVTMQLKISEKTYSIRVVNEFSWKKHNPRIETTVYLDGVKQESERLHIAMK